MNKLTKKGTIISLEIDDATGMRHADVIRSIRNMEETWMKVSERNFALSSYKQPNPNVWYKDVPLLGIKETQNIPSYRGLKGGSK